MPTIDRLRIAVISDIHGNLPALEAALAEIDAAEPEEVWCLGDVVGYGNGGRRSLRIDPVVVTGDVPAIAGPSTTLQPL